MVLPALPRGTKALGARAGHVPHSPVVSFASEPTDAVWIAKTLEARGILHNNARILTLRRAAARRRIPSARALLSVRQAAQCARKSSHAGTLSFARRAEPGQDAMKHAVTKELFAYWDKRRGLRALPDRSDIEPGPIRHILGDVFIAENQTGLPFRIAGTRICALFDRELRDTPMIELWDRVSRTALGQIVTIGFEDGTGTVASAIGETSDGRHVALELLILPLNHGGNGEGRLIGTLVPIKIPYWLEVVPVERLTLGAFRHVGPAIDENSLPSLVAPLTGAPQRETFVVHEGGRQD